MRARLIAKTHRLPNLAAMAKRGKTAAGVRSTTKRPKARVESLTAPPVSAPAIGKNRRRPVSALERFKQELGIARYREQNPHMWMQAQRLLKLLEIQFQAPEQQFPPGYCFLHANLVTVSSFCVKQLCEVNLETCQVTVEIHGDDNLEGGIVIIPLETIEWFGFPAKAVPVDIHFKGFAVEGGHLTPKAVIDPSVEASNGI